MLDASPPFTLPVQACPAWQQVHEQLLGQSWQGCTLLETGSLALYHYCVYKAHGRASDAARAQEWAKQLAGQLQAIPLAAWTTSQLSQACLLAWLSERLNAEGLAEPLALLHELDQQLCHHRLHLPVLPVAASREASLQVLRYFMLRPATPATHLYLRAVLAAWLSLPAPDPQLLGLGKGVAAELLICIQLAHAGIQTSALTQYVRNGLLQLLNVKRKPDFLEHCYSIFPYKISQSSRETIFSAELSWRRGDLGQALLFYESYSLLQDADLLNFADLIGLHTLLRTSIPATEITSISFCQGAAGVAHLYRQLYRLSRWPAYWQGYQYWLDQTQTWLQTKPISVTHTQPEASFVPDLVGVGLVLLSASTQVELGWEISLLTRWSN